jgi:hypothetical protein
MIRRPPHPLPLLIPLYLTNEEDAGRLLGVQLGQTKNDDIALL